MRTWRDSLGNIKILKIKSESLKTSTSMSPTDKIQTDFQHKIECSTCLVKFLPSVFKDHKKACSYCCPECTYKTKTIFGLNNHLGSHKDTQKVESEMCLTTFSKKKSKITERLVLTGVQYVLTRPKTIFGLNNHLAIHKESNENLSKLERKSYSTEAFDQENLLVTHKESYEKNTET